MTATKPGQLRKAVEALQRNASAQEERRANATAQEVAAAHVSRDVGTPLLRMPCATAELAAHFGAQLYGRLIDVVDIEDREVLIPGTHPAWATTLQRPRLRTVAHNDVAAKAASGFAQAVTCC